LTEGVADIPADLFNIARRATCFNAEERYATADELCNALRLWLAHTVREYGPRHARRETARLLRASADARHLAGHITVERGVLALPRDLREDDSA
jgi:hypothetical protein